MVLLQLRELKLRTDNLLKTLVSGKSLCRAGDLEWWWGGISFSLQDSFIFRYVKNDIANHIIENMKILE